MVHVISKNESIEAPSLHMVVVNDPHALAAQVEVALRRLAVAVQIMWRGNVKQRVAEAKGVRYCST